MKEYLIRTSVSSIILMVCGSIISALFTLIYFMDETATLALCLFSFLFGGILFLLGLGTFLLNKNGFIEVTDTHIHAHYGWGKTMIYPLEQVAFVLAQMNTLSVLCKNGKQYQFFLSYPWELCAFLLRKTQNRVFESPETISAELTELKAQRKKYLLFIFLGLTLLVLNIFLAVLLTGSRKFNDFTQKDWTIMYLFFALESILFILLLILGNRSGKLLLPIEYASFLLRSAVITTHKLPPGNAKGVYTNLNFTGRITLMGFPDNDQVYYTTEYFSSPFDLEVVDSSAILNGLDAEALDELTDISHYFFIQ